MSSPIKTVLGVVLILVVVGGFIYYVPVVPVTVQEPYQEIEEYQEQEPYTEQEAYTVDVEVTRTQSVCDYYCGLGSFVLEVYDFNLPYSKQYDLEWSSSDEVILFAAMTNKAYESFYTGLVLKIGLPAVLTIWSGGTLAPLTLPVMVSVLGDVLNVLSSENYYARDASSGSAIKQWSAGAYKIVVIAYDTSGGLNADITYDYQTTETQTRYRVVTKYRTVTKTRIVTKYKNVEKRITVWESLTKTHG